MNPALVETLRLAVNFFLKTRAESSFVMVGYCNIRRLYFITL